MDKILSESIQECSFLYSSFSDSSLSEDDFTSSTLPSTIYQEASQNSNEKLFFSNETIESIYQKKKQFKSRNLDYLSYLPDTSNSLICSNCSVYLSESCDYNKSSFSSDYQTLIVELQNLKSNMTKFKSGLVMNEIKVEFNHLIKNLKSELHSEIQSKFDSLAYEQSVISAKLAAIQCNLNCSSYESLDKLDHSDEVYNLFALKEYL